MSKLFRREIPLALVFILGWIMILDPFFKIDALNSASQELQIWASILVAFTLILAVFQSLRHYSNLILKRTSKHWYLGIWFILLLLVTIYLGITKDPFYSTWYSSFSATVKLAIYATTGLYTASAFFRAMRIRNIDAALLILTAVLTLIGNITVGAAIWPGFPLIRTWLQDVTNSSYLRASNIVLGIGSLSFGLRILLGKEKGQLGDIAT
ncbi:MAG: hypothetical protein ACFFDT_04490 [Candidatus Hodarchaeota archaeon]